MQKKIVVSGAGGGIGFAMVQRFLDMNCEVVAITRNRDKFSELLNQFENSLMVIELDFLDEKYEAVLVEKLSDIQKIDVLVNNAGLLINKPFEKFTTEEIQKLVTVNYMGTLQLTKSCLPALKESEEAHVVNISTLGAVQGSVKFPGLSIYASTKAAICTFTEVMAEENKNEGIHFNCLALGSVETPMFNDAFPGQRASIGAEKAADFIVDFAINKRDMFNGKILTVASNTP